MTHETTREKNARTNSRIGIFEDEATDVATDGGVVAGAVESPPDELSFETAFELSNFRLSLLAIAASGEHSGTEILEAYNRSPAETAATQGRLYPNLDVLVERGLIEKQPRNRRTHEYPVTPAGETLLEEYVDWLGQIKAGVTGSDAYQLSFDLTQFQVAALVAIGDNEPSGQAVKDTLEQYYSADIGHGRLYPNLDQLVDKGLVTKGSHDRRTNRYELTAAGRATVAARSEWLADTADLGGVR